MSSSVGPAALAIAPKPASTTAFAILFAISFSHMLNDMMQSLLPAIYPILRTRYSLNFAQIGIITLTFQTAASLLQPVVGMVTDRRPMPFSLPVGMGFTLIGLLLLSVAGSYTVLLIAAAMVGLGSSVFHPEASRVARMGSGGRHGLAQSLFQVGGNAGTAIGPLLAVFIVVPHGQGSIAWFSLAALLAMAVLTWVGMWYRRLQTAQGKRVGARGTAHGLSPRKVALSVSILVALLFTKFFYVSSFSTFYTFYLISKFHVSVQSAQVHLFIFLAAFAIGVLGGGPIGDRVGRR